jgi:hypothetical protein
MPDPKINATVQSDFYPADNPAVMAHINMIQGIINRLAGASASCKTWCIALVSALLSLAGATNVAALATVSLLPVGIFGFLDLMYLAHEKAYRDLHKHLVVKIRATTYDRTEVFEAGAKPDWGQTFCALVSWSIWPVYGGLVVLYFAARWTGWMDNIAKSVGS